MPEHTPSSRFRDAPAAHRYVFGEFEFDPGSGELRHDEAVVQLEPQPAKVLHVLVRRSGEVVPRSELRRHLWDDERHVEADQGLYYCIRELRRALGESARDPHYIETLRRRGYRFLLPVDRTGAAEAGNGDDARPGGAGGEGAADGGVEAAPGPEPGGSPPDAPGTPGRRRRRGSPWMVGAVVLALAAVAAWVVVGLTALVAPASQAGVSEVPRIGVLAFDAPGGTELDRALAAGVAGALVSELSVLGRGGLDVVPATSSFAFRESGKTVGQIGGELRADYLVEGSVRAGPGLQRGREVDVRLVDTENDSIVWIRTYAVVDAGPGSIARSVARDVTATLGLAPPADAAGGPEAPGGA